MSRFNCLMIVKFISTRKGEFSVVQVKYTRHADCDSVCCVIARHGHVEKSVCGCRHGSLG